MTDIKIESRKAQKEVPSDYWLHKHGLIIPSIRWTYQRLQGKRWYKQNVAK